MAISLTTILGGTLLSSISDIISKFKASPEDKLKLQEALAQNTQDLAVKQLELEKNLQDALTSEIQASAEIIKAEAGSQSWLPRNVRPLLLLLWGTLITANYFLPLVAQVFKLPLQPIALDPWVFKLTVIGFTGYVTARTWEKVKGADD